MILKGLIRICFLIILMTKITLAQPFNEAYVPLNVTGYVTNIDTTTTKDFVERKIQEKNAQSARQKILQNSKQDISTVDPRLKKIQDMYPNSTYSDVILPNEDEKEERLRGYKTMELATPNPVPISTDAINILCEDIGYNQDNQRNALQFYECVTNAMKTKFTEETRKNIEYHTMDANIVKQLKSRTSVDSVVENMIQYQDYLTQQNKMDCLNQTDYYKCVKTIVEYKKCENNKIEEIKSEYNHNKIVCYMKTAIRFPDPSDDEISARNSYYSVCNHLIQATLKEKISQHNIKCNQLLTKNNLLNITI